MKTIKAYLNFEHGKLLETGKYEPEISERAVAVESIKFFARHFIESNKLTGQINIESRDRKLYLRYDVKPKKYMKLLKEELKKRYDIEENE